MRKSLQQTEKWCEEHEVTLSFPEHDGIHHIKLSKGEPFIEVEYNPNAEDNGELSLGEAVDHMEQWLHGGIDLTSGIR
jgi:hypothetical protein